MCEPTNVKFNRREVLSNLGQEAGENPFRHSPDDGVLELVGLDLAAFARNLELNGMPGVGTEQVTHLHPAGLSHFSVEPHGRTLWQQKHKRPYCYGWKYRGAGDDVRQTA